MATAALMLIPALAYADVPVATITGPQTVAEPDTGNTADAVYIVQLTGGTGSVPVNFEYSVTGTATQGDSADYTDPENGVLSIGAGASSGTITLKVNADTVQEVGETLVVTLTKVTTDAGRVTIGSPNAVTTTIREGVRILQVSPPVPATVTEGQNAEFTVSLSGAAEALTVRYEVVPGTTTASDYTAPSGLLSFRADNNTINIETVNDMLAEDDESFTLKLSSVGLPDDVWLGIASAAVTIPENDTLTVSVVGQQATVVEDSTAVFIVKLMAGTSAGAGSQDVVVSYHTDASTATATEDYEVPSGTLIIPAGATTGTIMVPILADDLLEGDEKLILTLSDVDTSSGTANRAAADSGGVAEISVGDPADTVLVSVDDATANEGDPVKFTVTLSGEVAAAVTVQYAIANGTAISAQDYSDSTTDLVIDAGKTSGTISVQTLEDTTDERAEDPETFTVTLTSADPEGTNLDNSVQIGTQEATGTIVDDDVLTVTLTGDARVREGSPANYIVNLAGGSGSAPVVVTYEVDGTATEGTDYEPPSGTLEIPLGTPMGSIAIATSADQELGETLVVRLTGVTSAAGRVQLGTEREVATTMLAEDAVVVMVADAAQFDEAGAANFSVTFSGTLTEAVKLQYETVHGTATAADYMAKSDTLTIPAGDGAAYTTGSISVVVEDDDLAEADETFTLNLSLVDQPDDVVLATPTAKATIADNDDLTVTVSAQDRNVIEGSDAKFEVTLNDKTSTADVVVKFDVTGLDDPNDTDDALAVKDDYSPSSGTVTIPAGVTTGTIVISTTTDDVLEPTETFQVTLKTPTTTKGEVTVTGDPAMTKILRAPEPVTVSVTGPSGAVTEGGDAVFTLTLSGKVSVAVPVSYTVDGGSPETETIGALETTKTITVSTTDNTTAEESRTLTVALRATADQNFPSGVALGTTTATATIRDNDPLTVILEGPDRMLANAGAGDYDYTVRLKAGAGSGTGAATVEVDYTVDGVERELSIDPNVSSGDIPITGGDISGKAAGDSLVVRLTGVSTTAGRVSLGSPREKRTAIVDSATVLVSVTAPGSEVDEGADAVFAVSSGAGADGVTVRYTVVAGSAGSADYERPSGTLVLDSGGAGSITVSVKADGVVEASEEFSVRLTGLTLPSGVTNVVLGTTTATATIAADDELTATISSQPATVLEGNSAMFVVDLGGTSNRNIVIDYSIDDDGTAGKVDENDYTALSGKLTIRAGASKGTIVVATVDDDVLEPPETLKVTVDETAPRSVINAPSGVEAMTTVQDSGRTVTVSVTGPSGAVTEGGDAVFTLTLSGKVSVAVPVSYTVDGGSPETETIGALETTKTITVSTTDNTTAEESRTLTVALRATADQNFPSGVALGTTTATATIRDNDPLTVILEGPDRMLANAGAGDYDYTVRLKAGAGSGTGAATVEVDYTVDGVERELSIDPNVSSGDIPITGGDISGKAAGDSLVVRLTGVSTTAGRVSLGSPREKRTAIVDSATVLVSVTAPGSEVDEGADAVFAVSSGAGADGVTVRYTVVAGSAGSADYERPSGTLVLDSGGAGSITVSVKADGVVEASEEFSVRLTGLTLPSGVTNVVLGTTTATATIAADDELTATISSQPATVLEGNSAMFVVDLGGTSNRNIVIDYSIDDDGTAGKVDENDYTALSGKLTIRAGASKGTIVVATVDDDVLEPPETLKVTVDETAPRSVINAPSGVEAMTTIGASDGPVTVNLKDTTVDEGETAMVTVELSGMVGGQVGVSFIIAPGVPPATGVASCTPPSAQNDYLTPASPSVNIPKGETTGMIPIETCDDKSAEASEKFTLTLGTLTVVDAGGTAIPGVVVSPGNDTATVTITDDALTASVRGPDTVNEGDSAEYTVSVSGLTDEEIVVTYTVTSETATSQDYSPSSGTLTLDSEQTSQTFTIQIVDEPNVVDLREKLVVSIEAETSEGDPVRVEGPKTTTIVDDGTVEVSVEADPEIVPESRGEATFTVTMTGTVGDEPVILDYQTADGTATAPADYTADSGMLTIAAGDTSATITVPVIDDQTDEVPDETFNLTISAAAPPEGVEIDTAPATVTITDQALEASVNAPTPATVNEGQSVTFTVTLTEGDNRTGVTVDYELSGSAVAPGDYAGPSSGTLTIPQGQTTGTISRMTVADGVLDPGETLTVTLTEVEVVGAGLASVDSGQASATVTIIDQQTVTWEVDDISFDESQDAVFTVRLNGGLVQDAVTLTYATIAGGTATPDTDYTAVSNRQVTIPGGSPSATFTVQVTDDNDGEASETFEVELTLSSDAPEGLSPPSDRAEATIMDNDLALEPIPPVTVAEGDEKPIELSFDRMTTEPVTLSYETVDGTADFRDDYLIIFGGTPIPARGTVDLPPGIEAFAVTVHALDDSLAESTETFTVRVMLGNGGSPQVATVTITDTDTLQVSVTAPKTVAEGDVARFTVRVGGATSTAPVNVSYSLGGTAKAPADYSAPNPTMVSIPAGQQTATIAIQTKPDKVLEPDETLKVELTQATTTAGAAEVGSPKSATTTIQDPVYHSINRVNETLLPGVTRASAAGALEAVSARMALAAQGDPPAATADLAGLTGLYRALLANERAVQDGSYDLAQVLGGSSFLVPLSSHDGAGGGGIGGAVWGGGDFRQIGGGDEDADDVDWGGSVWSARLGADMRFIDSLLTGLVVSWTSGGLEYTDELAPSDREGTYATWLIGAYPYVGWSTTDFGLWATGGFGFGGVSIDDAEEAYDAQEADLTQWSLGVGGSVTLLSTDGMIEGGVTDLKLKAEGFLAGASVAENEAKTITQLDVGVNQARAAVEASHAQFFAGGGSLKPSLEVGGRLDGGDGDTGAGLEVGGGLAYADPGSGLTVAASGRALMLRDNYGEWGLSGLIQLDPNAAGHGLSMSVRPTIGVTASGVNGLWEHGTLDLLSGSQAGGRVEAEIGYGLPAFGMTGVLTPFAGAALTDAGAYSLSVGGRLELGPAFGLILEAERSGSTDPNATPEHDVTLEGSFRW